MTKKTVPALEFEKLVFGVADKAIASPEMPEASIHFARLLAQGHSEEEARRMIGTVIVTQIYLAKRRGQRTDASEIRKDLANLPKIGAAPDGRMIDIRGFEYSV